jgi:S-adenosylmethionine/arginine decarboxylase-like enzyme
MSSPDQLCSLLEAAVRRLCLTQVSPATAVHTDHGVAGVVLLAESHLAVHTIASQRRALVDLFSCVPIDGEEVTAVLRDLLAATSIESSLVERHP